MMGTAVHLFNVTYNKQHTRGRTFRRIYYFRYWVLETRNITLILKNCACYKTNLVVCTHMTYLLATYFHAWLIQKQDRLEDHFKIHFFDSTLFTQEIS